MSNEWIKMRCCLRRHEKVVEISSALNADRYSVVGGLHAVWSVFDELSADGVLRGYTPESMDREIGWPGFTQAMVDAGWMIVSQEGTRKILSIPKPDDHNGASAKRRALDADRKKRERESAMGPGLFQKASGSDADGAGTKNKKKKDIKEVEYSGEFEFAWAAYPERAGGNSKPDAFKAWTARIAEGVAPREMAAGVKRYAAYLQAKQKVGTEFVKLAATFFGPGKHWAEPYTIPAQKPGRVASQIHVGAQDFSGGLR